MPDFPVDLRGFLGLTGLIMYDGLISRKKGKASCPYISLREC